VSLAKVCLRDASDVAAQFFFAILRTIDTSLVDSELYIAETRGVESFESVGCPRLVDAQGQARIGVDEGCFLGDSTSCPDNELVTCESFTNYVPTCRAELELPGTLAPTGYPTPAPVPQISVPTLPPMPTISPAPSKQPTKFPTPFPTPQPTTRSPSAVTPAPTLPDGSTPPPSGSHMYGLAGWILLISTAGSIFL